MYEGNGTLTDYDVKEALDALIKHYKDENREREPRVPEMTDRPQQVVDAVKERCEMRLGRSPEGKPLMDLDVKPISLDALIRCLQRVRKSVPKWIKRGGRQGDLDFVSDFT